MMRGTQKRDKLHIYREGQRYINAGVTKWVGAENRLRDGVKWKRCIKRRKSEVCQADGSGALYQSDGHLELVSVGLRCTVFTYGN